MPFILLVAFSALFVAGCAAFFSIKGLIVLFSGSALAIGIMASSLEIGKLVAASFLHAYWNIMSKLLRLYLCLAVFVLMCVTSLGIFGFLSGAYQVHSAATNSVETKIEALQNEQATISRTIEENSSRVKTLLEIRAAQEERVKTAGNYKAPRDAAYKAIGEANEEMAKKEEAIVQNREKIIELDKQISALKISLNDNTDIGSFKFIAGALNTNVDTAVKYFIFTLIAVFDPLAVALVLCWNKLIETRASKKKEEQEALQRMLSTPAIEEDLKKKTSVKVELVETPAEVNEEAEAKVPETVSVVEPVVEEHIVEATEMVEAAEPEIVPTIAIEPLVPKKKEIPLDVVSNVPVGDVISHDPLESDPQFMNLSEEEKKAERARRSRTAGRNNSVITNG